MKKSEKKSLIFPNTLSAPFLIIVGVAVGFLLPELLFWLLFIFVGMFVGGTGVFINDVVVGAEVGDRVRTGILPLLLTH